MFSKLLKSIFGSSNDRAIRQLNRIVGKINKAEDGIRDRSVSRGLGDVYKRQELILFMVKSSGMQVWILQGEKVTIF